VAATNSLDNIPAALRPNIINGQLPAPAQPATTALATPTFTLPPSIAPNIINGQLPEMPDSARRDCYLDGVVFAHGNEALCHTFVAQNRGVRRAISRCSYGTPGPCRITACDDGYELRNDSCALILPTVQTVPART
jgi:hypothetical protein